MNGEKICLITFSNNIDHQEVIYSMFKALKEKADIYTIGIQNPKAKFERTDRNLFFDCPLRPGIEKKTFSFSELYKIANKIKQLNIKYIYFESMHIWNVFLMLLCPKCVKIVAVHDVIPHDGNKAMDMCNFMTCKMSDHIILRNMKYRDLLAKKYHLKPEKISCFEPWRHFPEEQRATGSKEFLCFGRIRKYKGFDLLEDIVKKTPEAKYIIAGEPDDETRPIVDRLKNYENVSMTDREVTYEEKRELFMRSDWVVLPYSAATQSGVICDALSMSRPVISFNVGAISEQIEDGKTGFLIPERDTDKFAEVVKLVKDYDLEKTQQMAHQAYQLGYKKYSAEAVSDRFLKVIKSCDKYRGGWTKGLCRLFK